MQDRYVADVGDFGKFQLFRYLFNHPQSPFFQKALAQIWFMHTGEGENSGDGRYIDYFKRIEGSDRYLEESLMTLLMRNKRQVRELESLKLLQNAIFFYDEVPKALEDRYLWLNKALTFANRSPIVAVAPDNGMALQCDKANQSFGFLSLNEHYAQKSNPHKHIFIDEVFYFYKLPYVEITVVYQHLSRCFAHNEQIRVLLSELSVRFSHVVAIKHKPYSPRVFFFLCKSDIIREALVGRLKTFEREFGDFWQLYV